MAQKGISTLTHPLEWDVAMNLLDSIVSPRDQIFIAIGFFSSLRINMIIKMKWCDILDNEYLFLEEKKTGKSRRIYINDKLRAICERSFILMNANRKDFILKGLRGPQRSHIVKQSANKMLKRILNQHGIKTKLNDSSHLLRKTWARRTFDYMAAKTGEEKALIYLCETLNHSNPVVTRRYIGLTEEFIEESYKNIDKCLEVKTPKDHLDGLSLISPKNRHLRVV